MNEDGELVPVDRRERAQLKAAFLQHYAAMGNVWVACQKVGISRRVVMLWKAQDPDFADAMELAYEDSNDILEAELWKQGRQGNVKALEIVARMRRPELFSAGYEQSLRRMFRHKTTA